MNGEKYIEKWMAVLLPLIQHIQCEFQIIFVRHHITKTKQHIKE